MKIKQSQKLFPGILLLFSLFLINGCVKQTRNPYPLITSKTVYLDADFAGYSVIYREKSNGSSNDFLIIYLDGSALFSGIGVKDNNKWKSLSLAYVFKENFSKNFNIMVPEKLNMEPGKSYKNDPKAIGGYSYKNRIKAASAAIDDYLDQSNHYRGIFLTGHSEGSQILPAVYQSLKNKEKIDKLVMLSSGGLSQYEQFKIFQNCSLPMSETYKTGYSEVDREAEKIRNEPDSTDKTWFGWPYRRWSGFLFNRPLDNLTNVNIPVLAVHGDRDISSPVESSRAIDAEFKRLNKTNLTYREYPGFDHGYNGKFQQVFHDVEMWLLQGYDN